MVRDLLSLPEGCTFALFNQKRKKAQLFICKNGLIRIPQIINTLRNNEHSSKELCSDLQDLELVILETNNDISILRLHMQYWKDYLKDLELETYNKINCLIYKSRVTTGYDYTGELRILVELVNRRNESFVVGVFEKMYEAKEFQKKYFDTRNYVYPVYANNEHTREYVLTRDSQLESIFKVRF
jgi:hypothetical protein